MSTPFDYELIFGSKADSVTIPLWYFFSRFFFFFSRFVCKVVKDASWLVGGDSRMTMEQDALSFFGLFELLRRCSINLKMLLFEVVWAFSNPF